MTSAATAVLGAAGLGTAWGVWGRSTATRAGTGGGVRAEGRKNAGLLADTTASDVPALVAIGGDGTGVAQVSTGQSYLDGDALALRAWTGVLAADGTHVAYAPLISAESAAHVTADTGTLDGAGSLVVALPATFTAACDTSSLAVTVSAVGAAMPGLFVTYRAASGAAGGYDGFTVSGGAAAGTVAWTAWATRRAVDLRRAGAGAVASSTPELRRAAGPGAGRRGCAGPGQPEEPAPPRSLRSSSGSSASSRAAEPVSSLRPLPVVRWSSGPCGRLRSRSVGPRRRGPGDLAAAAARPSTSTSSPCSSSLSGSRGAGSCAPTEACRRCASTAASWYASSSATKAESP